MSFSEFLALALPAVYALVGVALVVALVALARVLGQARSTIKTVEDELKPTLANARALSEDAREMAADVKPLIAKAGPLMDRSTLLLDAANLEMMRVDGILEDISEVADGVAKTTGAIESISQAPLNAVNGIVEKLGSAFRRPAASDETARLAAAKAEAASLADGSAPASAPATAPATAPAASAAPAAPAADEREGASPVSAPKADVPVTSGSADAAAEAADADDEGGYYTYHRD